MPSIKCTTKYCRGRVDVKHVVRKAGKCSKCRMRKWRAEKPLRAAWSHLKDHAHERRIEFTIPFDYFKNLVEGTGYIGGSGRFRGCLQVDRKRAWEGYIPGNLEILTVEENTAKGNRERHVPYYKEKLNERRGVPVPDDNDDPNEPF
jgi:hypothetical protein